MLAVLLGIYLIVMALYAWFSYALTADNLILSYWQPFFEFQWYMWNTFSHNRTLLTSWYVGLLFASFSVYGALLLFWWQKRQASSSQLPSPTRASQLFTTSKWRKALAAFAILLAPLMISSNALSYDVFNYIFNAKMVIVYQANPHVKTAFDYDHDEWVRFMHNTHTAAPYGYTWTGMSLLPYLAGGGVFVIIWFLFRVMSVLSLIWLGWEIIQAYRRSVSHKTIPLWALGLFFLNPLVLLEVVTNFHNDLWMMAPAVASLGLVMPDQHTQKHPFSKAWLWLSGVFLLFSISVKLATILLIPLWLLMVWYGVNNEKRLAKYSKAFRETLTLIVHHWPLWASLALFLPLFTIKSQQFHPWYLTWSLSFLPLFPLMTSAQKGAKLTSLAAVLRSMLTVLQQAWLISLLVLSLSAMLRYYPFLQVGSYVPQVLAQRLLITWIPFAIALVVGFFFFAAKELAGSNSSIKKSR